MTTIHRARALALLILAATVAAPLNALDLSLGGFFGNLGLPWTGETAMTWDQYPANLWLYGGHAAFTEEFAEGFSLRVEYQTDPVLRHVVRGVVTYETGVASMSAGPMVGTFNTAQNPLKAGIDIGFRIEAPGIAFFSVDTASSMGVGLASEGDYSQEFSEITAGWYVYNAICSVLMTTKRFTRVPASGTALVDASTDYRFSVDVYKKGAPYRVVADLGYRTMTRSYDSTTADGLDAIVLGASVDAQVSPWVNVTTGLDSGVYVFGIEELAGRGPAATAFIFQATLGAIIKLPSTPTP